jgi:UDP-glucuronate 4-epimerase
MNIFHLEIPFKASTDRLQEAVGFKPSTSIEEGLQRFADWYAGYYGVK